MAEDAPDWAKGDETPEWAQSTRQEKSKPQMLDEAVSKSQGEAITGAKRGLIGGLGTFGDISSLMSRAAGVDPALAAKFRGFPTSEEVGKKLEPVIGNAEGPSSKPIEFLSNPLSWLGPGSGLSKLISAIGGGVGADVGSKLGKPGSTASTVGEVGGAILGGGLVPKGAGKVVTPGKEISANRKTAETILKNEGVEVTAGQLKGSQPLRTAESQLGTAAFSGDVATEQSQKQLRQFTRAALLRVGESADLAEPHIVDRAFDRIGAEFDRLQNNFMYPDKQFTSEIGKARQDYINVTSPVNRSEYIPDIANRLSMYGHKGLFIEGKTYKESRSTLDRIRRGSKDPAIKDAVQDIIQALDGAMERTLAKTNPADAGKWREVRRQYRNMLVIEKAATGAGEAAAEGVITPAKLRQAVIAQSRRSYGRGKGDFADLARAGEFLMTPMKTSKTAERAMIGAVPVEIGGALASLFTGNLPLAGALAGSAVAPGLAGRAIHSRPVQGYLKNQAAIDWLKRQPPATISSIRALLNVLGDRSTAQ